MKPIASTKIAQVTSEKEIVMTQEAEDWKNATFPPTVRQSGPSKDRTGSKKFAVYSH